MKKNFLLAILAAVFVVWGCGDSKEKKSSTDDDTEETGKKKKKTADDEETPVDDETSSDSQGDPAELMRTIFKAAKSGNFSSLTGLCAVDDGDNDVKMICGIDNESSKKQEEFKEYFAKGKVVGEPTIDGDEASVEFMFGPDGDKGETMRMIKKGKKWYLRSY
jgi:protein involved in sex pheromone biosynthesis